MALRDLAAAQKEIERLENENRWVRFGKDLLVGDKRLAARVAELELEVERLSVSPVLPSTSAGRLSPRSDDDAVNRDVDRVIRFAAAMRFIIKALPWALCGAVLRITWDGSIWLTFLLLLLAWNIGRFGPSLLIMCLAKASK